MTAAQNRFPFESISLGLTNDHLYKSPLLHLSKKLHHLLVRRQTEKLWVNSENLLTLTRVILRQGLKRGVQALCFLSGLQQHRAIDPGLRRWCSKDGRCSSNHECAEHGFWCHSCRVVAVTSCRAGFSCVVGAQHQLVK